jgi:hypothetical protein
VKIIQQGTADKVLQKRERQRSAEGNCQELLLRKKYYVITLLVDASYNKIASTVSYLDSYIITTLCMLSYWDGPLVVNVELDGCVGWHGRGFDTPQ